MILDKINKTGDIKNIDPADYNQLASEIRDFLVEKVSRTGGHLASSLGAVELTMALHLSFDPETDKLIWDVGHQSYTHKILTGRKDGFDNLRELDGISGFPNRFESPADTFTAGHSTTSVSAGLGLAQARQLSGEKYSVVSIIGDGAFTGGMAYEALNNAGRLKSNFIIVLNDNNMSISSNVGGVSGMLSSLRTAPKYIDLKENVKSAISKLPKGQKIVETLRNTKSSIKQLFIPGMIFEDMDITYLGPVDGTDITEMLEVFEDAKRMESAVVVHVITKKGQGYAPAEADPERFHGIGRFDPATGESLGVSAASYSKVAGAMLCKLAEKDDKIACVTAAMTDGTGLKKFSKLYPERFFDVGIAEQHAVTFSSGLAAGGMKPFFCVYSSFLQRAYDQIIHDVCLQKLPVRFLIDRAGLVGKDGETHQGAFDMAFLSGIPGMTVLAPKNAKELTGMIRFAAGFDGPIAIRYPRGEAYRGLEDISEPVKYGKAQLLYESSGTALFAAGSMVKTACEVRDILTEKGINVTVVNARFIKPFDTDMIKKLSETHSLICTMEDGALSGGLGEHISAYISENRLNIKSMAFGLPDEFVTHGDTAALFKRLGLDAESIADKILQSI